MLGALLVWVVAIVAPLAAFVAVVVRHGRYRPKIAVVLGTIALGAALFVPCALLEHALERWTGLDAHAPARFDLSSLVYMFLVVAPLEQGLKVAAVIPVWRTHHLDDRLDAVTFAAAAALGFGVAHGGHELVGHANGAMLARVLLSLPAHLFFASTWGYVLGRDRDKRLGGRVFNATFLVATLFNGVYEHIVFTRSLAALVAAVPVVLGMAALAYAASRDLLDGIPTTPPTRRRFLPSIAPPSIRAMREALRRTERPVMLRWIGFGALVTTGVITAAIAAAVAVGHEIGVDFAAADRSEGTAGIAPLLLLGGAALAAFPVAGFLVARASSTRTVLEPAMSAALAIAGSIVLLGLAAPVAVVFAIAFAPIAFGLACAGAWVGLGR